MAVKIVILKSLEDVIADVTEYVSGLGVVGYVLENPYVVSLNEEGTKVGFYPYAPLAKDTSIKIPTDWVVAIVEPKDEVKNSYVEKISGKSENTGTQE
jgi:hypothetical protein